MTKIKCPSCGTEFSVIRSDDYTTCPTCSTALYVDPSVFDNDAFDFEECVIETSTVMLDLEDLDDESLVDEIAEEIHTGDYMKGTFVIFAEYDMDGELSEESRKMAEGIYLLAHTNCFYGETH